MKTPEEIKKGLWCCSQDDECGICPYANDECHNNKVKADALSYIQQLEAKDVKQYQIIAELEKELAAVRRERDAAVSDMKQAQGCVCNICKSHYRPDPAVRRYECKILGKFSEIFGNDDYRPMFCDKFEWRGVCPDTEAQDEN